MKGAIAAMALGLLVACPKDETPVGSPVMKRMPPPMLMTPAAMTSAPAIRTEDVPVRLLSQPDPAPLCQVGQSTPCACPGGKVQGTRTCLAPDGTLSECGCPKPGGADIAVPPVPPTINKCGVTTCAPYPQEETSAGAHHCCTPDRKCGSSSDFLFGRQCIPRGGPVGKVNAACADEFPNFLDLYGCCRPDGQCGLTVDHIQNWDIGCVERSEMARLLNAGSFSRDILSRLFLLPVKSADFAPARCTP